MNIENAAPLEFVLEFERKGVEMYLKLASEVENTFGKELFYTLASEEVQHARKADKIYTEMRARGAGAVAPEGPRTSLETKIKAVFDALKPARPDKGTDNIKGYELAMKVEKEGYGIYKGFLKTVKTAEEKEFFTQILKEEKEHIDAIANVYQYLTNSGDWLQEEESKTWNWMNQ